MFFSVTEQLRPGEGGMPLYQGDSLYKGSLIWDPYERTRQSQVLNGAPRVARLSKWKYRMASKIIISVKQFIICCGSMSQILHRIHSTKKYVFVFLIWNSNLVGCPLFNLAVLSASQLSCCSLEHWGPPWATWVPWVDLFACVVRGEREWTDPERVSGHQSTVTFMARPLLLMHQLNEGKNEALTVQIEKAFTDVIGNDAKHH